MMKLRDGIKKVKNALDDLLKAVKDKEMSDAESADIDALVDSINAAKDELTPPPPEGV